MKDGPQRIKTKMELGAGFNIVLDADTEALKDLNEKILFDLKTRDEFLGNPQKFLADAGIQIDRRLIPDEATLRRRIDTSIASLTSPERALALVCGAVCVGPPIAPVGCVVAVI